MKELTNLELLRAVQYALNTVHKTRLRGAPHGIGDTYQLAAIVDKAIEHAENNKEPSDH